MIAKALPHLAVFTLALLWPFTVSASAGANPSAKDSGKTASPALPPAVDFGDFQPKEGDVFFQSLPRNALINAIEGATESPYSHCGILLLKNGQWQVREALGTVQDTPLPQWIQQGRDKHFDVFRLRKDFQPEVPKMLSESEKYLGRPYDIRYDMDDAKIYCSELIFKSYRDATRQEMGKLVKLGDLKWESHKPVILAIEGSLPLSRLMITPRHLSEASQLELVFKSSQPRGKK